MLATCGVRLGPAFEPKAPTISLALASEIPLRVVVIWGQPGRDGAATRPDSSSAARTGLRASGRWNAAPSQFRSIAGVPDRRAVRQQFWI